MRLVLLIFFLTHGLVTVGQYKFEIVRDLEPELSEQWTLEFIKKKKITKVSVNIKSFSYKIFKYRKTFDALYYNSLTNEIKFKEIDVSPSPDKGGYIISHFRDITLNYDSSDKIISRIERPSNFVVKVFLAPESTTKIQYENDKIVSETKIESDFISSYEYKYFQDSINVLYATSTSSDKLIVKRQYLNKNSQLEMELINQFGKIDTVLYKYNGDILSSKVHLREDAFDFTYNDKGKISSRCMKANSSNNCSYFKYTFKNNNEFREEVDGNNITTTEIKYNLDDLITKKIVRYNGRVIIKYKYSYS